MVPLPNNRRRRFVVSFVDPAVGAFVEPAVGALDDDPFVDVLVGAFVDDRDGALDDFNDDIVVVKNDFGKSFDVNFSDSRQ